MIYSPETNAVLILTSSTLHLTTLLKSLLGNVHSVHAGSSSSRLTRPSFFFLLHVASFLAGSWLLIFLPAWGAWPSLTPFPRADPISLRSQAMPHSYVGHNYNVHTVHCTELCPVQGLGKHTTAVHGNDPLVGHLQGKILSIIWTGLWPINERIYCSLSLWRVVRGV